MLLPLTAVPAATAATVMMLVAPVDVGVTVPVLPVDAPELNDTPVDVEPAPGPTNVVDAAERPQAVVPPRRSLMLIVPSEPETDAEPVAAPLRFALAGAVTLRLPLVRLKVVMVSAAVAEPTGTRTRMAPVTATVPMVRREFMVLCPASCEARPSA